MLIGIDEPSLGSQSLDSAQDKRCLGIEIPFRISS
jgi:hypothetical protein